MDIPIVAATVAFVLVVVLVIVYLSIRVVQQFDQRRHEGVVVEFELIFANEPYGGAIGSQAPGVRGARASHDLPQGVVNATA